MMLACLCLYIVCVIFANQSVVFEAEIHSAALKHQEAEVRFFFLRCSPASSYEKPPVCASGSGSWVLLYQCSWRIAGVKLLLVWDFFFF